VAVGITIFADSAINANRDALTNDLVNLASRAQQYYRRPTSLGGGGYSFAALTANAAGIALLTNKPLNGNGSYYIKTAGAGTGTAAVVELEGRGNETGKDNATPVVVHIKVFRSTDSCWIVN
jgi:hypothetical protein